MLAATVMAGTVAGASAADGSPATPAESAPRIVSAAQYTEEGGADPQSMAPVGEVSPAQGDSVQELTNLLARTTGLDLLQAPAVADYDKVGQSLTFSLGDENVVRPLNITRLTVHGDVPSSVLSSDGDTTQTTTLPSGSQLFTAVGNDGVRISTLSRDGRLTQWEAPAISAEHTYSTEDLVRWATAVDEQNVPASHSPTSVVTRAAKPHCQLIHSNAPYLHGGYTHIQADAQMLCNQRGKGNFEASLRQYQGLGIWKTKDVRGYTNTQGQNFSLLLHYDCSRLTTSGWVYREDIGNATLRNGNGYWGDHNVWSKTATIHCA
ncbi:hypothetical protein [Streptomyces sp. AGS-58]|uniref:hypothetical protein n=1 Tax=unclassified Streptomyces TaxID=2593676 RepID=UPI0035A31A93